MANPYADWAKTLARSLHRSLPQELSSTLDIQLANLPPRYFRSYDPTVIHNDISLIHVLSKDGVIVNSGPLPASTNLLLRVLLQDDKPRVFLRAVGILARHRLNVLRASLYTGLRDRMVLDHFEIQGPLQPGLMARACEELDHALRTGDWVEPVLPPPDNSGLSVTVDNNHSAEFTTLNVNGRDQRGFLYRVAKAFVDCRVDLWDAAVRTHGDQVVDRFHVVSESGRPLTPTEGDALRRTIVAAFSKSGDSSTLTM